MVGNPLHDGLKGTLGDMLRLSRGEAEAVLFIAVLFVAPAFASGLFLMELICRCLARM